MYIVVAGADEVAFNIAEALMSDHEVVLIGPEDRDLARLHKLDINVLPGMCTVTSALVAAGVPRCDAFVAATEEDERNLVACIAARKLGAHQTVCVLNQPGFLAVQESDGELARDLGVDGVVRPTEQLAQEIVRVVTVPGALDVEHFARGAIRLLRHPVEQDAPIARNPLRKTILPPEVVLVMGRRGEEVFIPSGDTHLQPGDKVTAMGTAAGIRELLYYHLRGVGHDKDDLRATVIGGGDVGLLVTKGLERAGWRVKVIEVNRDRCEVIAPQLQSLVLHGDGSDIDLLEEEQVTEAPVLVAVTDNDEKNLLVSLLARNLGVERIITRAGRLTNERMFERVGVDVVRSAHGAAVRSVVRRVGSAGLDIRAELEHGDMHVLEIELPSDYPAIRIRDLHTNLFSIIGSIIRGRQVVVPRGHTRLEPGDHLFIFCRLEDEARSRKFYLNPPPPPDLGEEEPPTEVVEL